MEIFIVVALGALLLFMVFNTRKKQRQQQENLSTNLVPGARVMTTFGLFGTVLSIDEEENKVTIESAPGTVLTLHKQTIGRIEPAADETPAVAVPDDASSLHDGEDKTYGEQVDARRENNEAPELDTDASDTDERQGPKAAGLTAGAGTGRDAGAADDSDADEDASAGRDTVAGQSQSRTVNESDDIDAVPGEQELPREGTLNDRDPENESSLESAEPQGPSSDDAPDDERPTKA